MRLSASQRVCDEKSKNNAISKSPGAQLNPPFGLDHKIVQICLRGISLLKFLSADILKIYLSLSEKLI